MTILQIQAALILLGHDPGTPDNQNGPKTRKAVSDFQYAHGLPADGMAGLATEKAIRQALADFAAADSSPAPDLAPEPEEIEIPYPLIDGYYQIPKGANVRVSKDFTSSEWDCQGVGCCTVTKIAAASIKNVQGIRTRARAPVTITSGYRCPVHNRDVRGATGSYHLTGDATDIVVANHTPRQIAQDAESNGITGIGLYETQADGFFVHVDPRPYKSYWYGQGQACRSTFY